jgi:hypothetical protein
MGSFQAAYGKLQEWTATSDAAQRRLAQRAASVAQAVESLAAGSNTSAGEGPATAVAGEVGPETGAQMARAASAAGAAAPDPDLVAARQVVAEQMEGLQQLMAAEAGKHRAAFDEALKVRARGSLIEAAAGPTTLRQRRPLSSFVGAIVCSRFRGS